jgi:hypothetical protein
VEFQTVYKRETDVEKNRKTLAETKEAELELEDFRLFSSESFKQQFTSLTDS